MLTALLKLAATTAAPEPVALGTRRELFVDRALVDRRSGSGNGAAQFASSPVHSWTRSGCSSRKRTAFA
jgi:hypothetical protein